MAAYRRRTVFAAPFVITVAASCSTRSAPPEAAPQLRRWSVYQHGVACEAIEQPRDDRTAPRAVECPPGMAAGVAMTIEQEPGKSYCTSRALVTPCPLPPGQEVKLPLDNMWLVEKDGPECHAEDYSRCPKGADCNPPRPRYFPCPPGVSEDRPMIIAELGDGTCVRAPDGCADTGCARDQVPCLPAGVKPATRD